MKLCIFGAGAVGGYLAARLAKAGAAVSMVARGAHLDAVRRDGLTLIEDGTPTTVRLPASADARELGPQDAVIVTAKATDPARLAASLPPLLGPETPVAFAQNGIPWWYAHGYAGAVKVPDLAGLDPGGALAREVGVARAIGCVIYAPMEVTAPGTVRASRSTGIRFVFGEPDGRRSARVEALAAAVAAAGVGAEITADIRLAVWEKLWRNVGQSLLCALTGKATPALRRDPRLAGVARALIGEVLAVAAAFGCPVQVDIDRHFAATGPGLDHRPSILQDLEAGRAMEIDVLCLAVQDFARAAGVPTPHLDTVTALLIDRAVAAGCWRG